jgi:ankyrin repeat protein
MMSRFAAFVRSRDELVMRCILACAQLAALLWFAIPRGLPLDDAWIHQVVARTFAESGTLGYAPGEHGAAATSYLWAALLAVNFKLLHVSPVTWAFVLNAIASIVTGQGLFSLLIRGSSTRVTAFAATLLACTSGNVLWFAHSGMEASLFLALSVTAIWATTLPDASVRIHALGGIAVGLLALTRPEAAPLCGLLVLYVIARKKGGARTLAVGSPVILAGIVYVGSNLAKTGHATPTTLSGRRWLWFETTAGLSGFDRGADFVEAWAERLSTYTFDTGAAAFWIMLALALYGALKILRVKGDGLRMLFAWGALHTFAYVFLLPTPGHGGRYQPFVPLLYTACIGLGTAYVVEAVFRARPRALAWSAVAVVPWVVFSLVTTTQLRKAHALAVAHIEATEIGTGKYVDTLPRDGTIASFDIGGIGWATRRPILDAGGLSDPKTAAVLERGRIFEYLKSKDVRYVVLPESWERVLPTVDHFVSRLHLDNPGVRLTRLHELETPFENWQPSITATWNAAPKQVVYRIEYTAEAPPRDVPMPAADAHKSIRDDASLVRERERRLTEHALSILEAWGMPVRVRVTPAASKPTADGECAIDLGMWGIEVAGCDAIVEVRVLRSVLYEHLSRFFDVSDLGGAVRALPFALTAAKRAHDPAFHPPIAPLALPNAGLRDRTLGWGLPLAFAIAALVTLLDSGALRRLRGKTDARARSPVAASAVGLFTMAALASVGVAGCGGADLHEAMSLGRGAVDIALARGADLEARDGGGRTPLIDAAGRGDLDIVNVLVARGALVDARDSDDATALHHAARGGHHACALVLARAGAPIDAVAGIRKRTALHDATLAGSEETVRVLLASGADARVADTFGETAMHLLARAEGSRASLVAPLLLAAGTEPSTRLDARGFTAAHAAAVTDNAAVLRALASASLVSSATPSGETAVDTAMRYGKDKAADVLVRAGAKMRDAALLPPLHDAARMDSVGRITELLAAGADPTFEYAGKTALIVAHEHGSRGAEALLTRPARSP